MLEARIRERIRRDGLLSFSDFMAAALYDSEDGYYTKLARFEDFRTSPEVHPAFGWLIARQALDVWTALGKPEPFRVLELGGGSGALADAIASRLGEHVPRLEYVIDEPSPSLCAVQRRRLRHRDEFAWHFGERAQFIVANEVADALPVHRVIIRGGRLCELRVGLDEHERFTWFEADDAPADVEAYFERLRILPPEGATAEVSTGLADWVSSIAARLELGVALILDYGYPADRLFSRPQGTLLTYYRHTQGSDPLIRVGQQDISTHVDFSTLAMSARAAGLRVVGVTSQARLLLNLGIAALEGVPRAAVAELTDPQGLGRIGALFVERGLTGFAPIGLTSHDAAHADRSHG